MITGFPPLAREDATTLILGSMPSAASLRETQYYGNPHNSFWFVMSALTGIDSDAAYGDRVVALLNQQIAVWDVVHTCHRQGSLDSAIKTDSIMVNDFETFFRAHPHIKQVIFNGATAEKEYHRRAQPLLSEKFTALRYQRLPSTSPAMASLTPLQKQTLWMEALC